MSGSFTHDFNGAEAQQDAFEPIPAGTLAKVRLTIRPGGVGPEGWVTQSRTSEAQYLNTEAVIVEGPHARRRVFTRIGLRGKGGQGDDTYANRGRALIRGILESARGIASKDSSDRARAANPKLKLLGLSATPERGDGHSLRKTFSNIAYHLPISALIAQGILVPPRAHRGR